MIRSILKLGAFGVLLFVLMSLLAPAGVSQKEIYRRAASQTFRMLDPDNIKSGGTGFVVKAPSGQTYIVSNAHVCGVSERDHMLAERNGRMIRTPILEISSETDLCLLVAPPGYDGLEVADSAYILQQVYAVGHPRLGPVTISAGWIRSRETVAISYCRSYRGNRTNFYPSPMSRNLEEILAEMECIKEVDSYVTNAAVQPGSSGSAMLSDEGKVVGVAFAGDPYGTSLMVPLDRFKRFLQPY